MIRFKCFRLVSFIFAVLLQQQAISLPITVCLTGQIETTLSNYKPHVINAAMLALSQNSSKNIILKTYFYDNQPLSTIKSYEDMLKDNCSAIIGYAYLSDLLLIQKIQKKTDISIFSTYASTNDEQKLANNFFIFEPTYDFQSKNMLIFLKKKYDRINNALIITEVDRDDLIRYKSAYVKLFKEDGINYDTFDMITNDSHVEKKLITFIKSKHKQYKYIFLLTGAVGSINIINFINNHKIIFVGTENFGSSYNQSVYIGLNDKNVTAYSIRNLDILKKNIMLNKFANQYREYYGDNPYMISAYTYDAMNIIIQTFRKFHKVTPENILKINFNGITGAHIKGNKFYRSNDYVTLSIESSGFNYVE